MLDLIVVMFSVLVFCVITIALLMIPLWFQAEKECILINKNFNTNYTTSDLFWTSDIVKNYLHGKKLNLKQNIIDKTK